MDIEKYLAGLTKKGVEIWIDENDEIACRAPDNALTGPERKGLEDLRQDISHRLRKGNFISSTYPLSVGQEALWFIYKTDPESTAYNTCPYAFRIGFEIDPSATQAAFQALVNRHACLRTLFRIQKNGTTVQQVYAHRKAVLERIDAAGRNEAQLRRTVEKAYHRPFDLENDIPVKMFLISRSMQDHVLLVTIHHIVTDLTSDVMLVEEFQKIWRAKTGGEAIRLPFLNRSFKDFVASEKNWINSPGGKADLAYWRNQLAGELAPLDLPFDYPRPPVQTFKGETLDFGIDIPLSRKIKSLSSDCKTSLLRVFLTAFTILLHRYSGQKDVLVGIPASVRPLPGFKECAGYFINMLPIRTDLSKDPDFLTLLGQVNQTLRDGIRHIKYPFPAILKALRIDRDLSHTPVFQSTFTLYDKPLDMLSNETDGLNRNGPVEPFPIEQQVGQFDLAVSLYKTRDAFTGSWDILRSCSKASWKTRDKTFQRFRC